MGASAPLPPAGGSAGFAPTVRSQKRSGRGKKTAETNSRKRRGRIASGPYTAPSLRTPSTPSRRHVSSARRPQAPVRLSPAPQRFRRPGGPEDARCVTGALKWPRCAGRSRAERASVEPKEGLPPPTAGSSPAPGAGRTLPSTPRRS